MSEIKSKYYTVKDIQKLEKCGRDKAYEISKELPHEFRGKQIFVFVEDYESYYERKRENALEKKMVNKEANLYKIRKFC